MRIIFAYPRRAFLLTSAIPYISRHCGLDPQSHTSIVIAGLTRNPHKEVAQRKMAKLLGHYGLTMIERINQGIADRARNDGERMGIAGRARNDSKRMGIAGRARNDGGIFRGRTSS